MSRAEAQITPEDINRAKAAAGRDGSPLLNAMLNATVEPETAAAPPIANRDLR